MTGLPSDAPDKINLTDAVIEQVNVGFGHNLYLLWARSHGQPLSFLWGVESEMKDGRAKFDIHGMYTLPWAQRSGCATRICDELTGAFEILVTDNGSDTGGEAFLRSYGFTQHRETGQWYCIRPKTEAKDGKTDGGG